MLGLKPNVYCLARSSLAGLLSATAIFMTQQTPLFQIPEAGVQLPERWVTLHLYTWQYVQVWGNGCAHDPLAQHWVNLRVSAGVGKWLCTQPSHPTLGEPQGFSRCREMAVHTTLSPNPGWTSGFQQVWGNGCAHDPLTQPWVNLRVSAGMGKQGFRRCWEMVVHATF